MPPDPDLDETVTNAGLPDDVRQLDGQSLKGGNYVFPRKCGPPWKNEPQVTLRMTPTEIKSGPGEEEFHKRPLLVTVVV